MTLACPRTVGAMRGVVSATAAAFALLASACAATSAPQPAGAPSPNPSTRVLGTAATQPSGTAPCGRGGSAADYRHVIWIWMENRSYSQVLGPHGQAPRLASYGHRCAVATAYYAVTHPSLPNYLAAVSGKTGGVASDCAPTACRQWRPTIFRQLSQRPAVALARGEHDIDVRPDVVRSLCGAAQPRGVLPWDSQQLPAVGPRDGRPDRPLRPYVAATDAAPLHVHHAEPLRRRARLLDGDG